MLNKFGTLDGAGSVIRYGTPTAAETFTYGEALKFASGAFTKASTTDTPAAIYLGKLAEGYVIEPVRPDNEYLIDVSGATALVSGSLYALDATGLLLDSATVGTGHLKFIKLVGTKALVQIA
jgi:hypothetical protein